MESKELPFILTPKDLEKVLHISRNKVYEMLHSDGFPSFKLGNPYRVSRDKFLAWLSEAT